MNYPYGMAVFAARNREIVFETVVKALEQAAAEDGITQKMIAENMGRKPSQVSNWLSGPSNWTLDTVSDLLRAIGATMEYRVVRDRDRAPSNVSHDAGHMPLPPPLSPPPAVGGSPVSNAAIFTSTPLDLNYTSGASSAETVRGVVIHGV